MSSDMAAVLAIVVPVLAGAAAFFVLGSRKEGADRRKYMVGGTTMLICAIGASIVAWTLVQAGPPGS